MTPRDCSESLEMDTERDRARERKKERRMTYREKADRVDSQLIKIGVAHDC